ncbi:LytR/AlgR family response regulator transcription factor [Colwelliaceae bacterium 6471]
MTIKCWIIDDEPAAHKGIEIALRKHADFELVYHGYNADTGAIAQLVKPDVVFLDIEMPGGNGFKLLDCWPNSLPHIIFITAYNEYAVQAFDNNALDYLLKPIEQERFDVMTDKVRQRINEQGVMLKKSTVEAFYKQVKCQRSLLALSIKTSDGLFHIKQKDVIYIESVGDHLAFHFADKTLLCRDSFKRIAVELDPSFFFRTHKSYMVNSAHVAKIERTRFGDGKIEMSNQHQVKMSRRYKAILNELNND